MANIVPARLQEAMDDREFDQSSLARAVGCTPGAINQIMSGNVRRSRLAPEIAFQLGVTYDWLTGQSEEKHSKGRSSATIAADERELLHDLRGLRPQDRSAISRIASALRQSEHRVWSRDLPPEAALARMFEGLLGLLEVLPEKPDLDARARLLAQWLPIGLSQLRDLMPDDGPEMIASGVQKEMAEALPKGGREPPK